MAATHYGLTVYITCKNQVQAQKIATALIKENLAACANTFPIKSVYKWKGKLVKEKECALVLKTTQKKYPQLEKRAKQLHSYKVPCIVAFKWAAALFEYEKWVEKSCK